MESINSGAGHIVLRGTYDIFTCRYLDEIRYMDFDRSGDLLCLLDASQQIKRINNRGNLANKKASRMTGFFNNYKS